MPRAGTPLEEKKRMLKDQFDGFLRSDALGELLSLLETDIERLPEDYSGRKKVSGGIMETQDMRAMPELEPLRHKLYPLFDEMGAFRINSPVKDSNTSILIYGGALGACFDRTGYGAQFVTAKTTSVDALTCYRPINPVERKKSGSASMADTEFGALTEAFEKVFGLSSSGWDDSFHGDRNLNSISCCRMHEQDSTTTAYRIYAAPSSDPEIRRADTGDCLSFYLKNTHPGEEESLLTITNNRYCNRQFIQTAYELIVGGCDADFDIVGCHPDEKIIGVEKYDPMQYLQDLIGVLDWIEKFRRL